MDLSDTSSSTIWWVIAGLLVLAELSTGSFFLLMLALGAAAGALAGHAGLGLQAQLIAAAAVGGAAVAGWYRLRQGRVRPPAGADRNVNLDIGETVHVSAWDAEGCGQVSYRGASWQARHGGEGPPQPGPHRIRAIEGNRLVLERC